MYSENLLRFEISFPLKFEMLSEFITFGLMALQYTDLLSQFPVIEPKRRPGLVGGEKGDVYWWYKPGVFIVV